MGFLSGGIGGIVNSITGASNSARQQNRYAVGMANLNFKQQKEMLLKGPTWQMQGYKDAGVNPMYGFEGGTLHGGGGNSAGGAGTGGQIANLSAIADIYNNTRATSANNNNLNAQAEYAHAQALATIEMLPISKEEKRALIKYTNERSRGYSQTTTITNPTGPMGMGGGGTSVTRSGNKNVITKRPLKSNSAK